MDGGDANQKFIQHSYTRATMEIEHQTLDPERIALSVQPHVALDLHLMMNVERDPDVVSGAVNQHY